MKKMCLILCTLLSVLLVSCTNEPSEYTGEYPELYSVAINSIPDTFGFFVTEIIENPRIELIESDNYNRRLFLYFEGNNISTYSLLVVQFSTENEVCFLSGQNYISSPSEDFDETSISQLKIDNDWNTELSEDKCDCVPITTSKDPLPLSYEQIKPFYESVFPGDEHFSDDRWIRYFISDDYGRILITVEARNVDEWAIMMFYPDGTYDSEDGFLIFTDFYTYQGQLVDYLENANWNEPLQ